MTTTIQAQVSQATLSKVSRLFNASLTDCFNELLQNARRAWASVVIVTLTRARQLVIADDGVGIANPQTLLTLGESDWSNEIQQREAPAGMGIFSLANRNVLIRSHNWQVHLTPAHFAGEARCFADTARVAVVEPCEMISGTRLSFTIEEKESKFFEGQVCHIARFYPLPLWLNGREIPRQDFLDDALYIESWQGLRIGIRYTYQWKGVATINFYGLVLEQGLPSLGCNGQTLFLRLDVVDCPQLKLVLPARKEVVQDEFWSDLTIEVQRILYRYVATLPHHDLSYRTDLTSL